MQHRSIHRQHRRQFIGPVLLLAYALLIQSVLGPVAATAQTFIIAEHDALGLSMLCADGGNTQNRLPLQEKAPQGDCLTCKIACTSSFGIVALPAPEASTIYIASPRQGVLLYDNDSAPLTIRYRSDLASRAPPAIQI